MPEKPQPRYNVERMVADMALKGWIATDLARAANLSNITVSRFLRCERQNARTAERLARALGYSPRRYLMGVGAAA